MQIYKILSINTIEYIRYLTELPEQLELSRISDYLEWYLTRTESSFLFNEISSQTDFYYRNIIIAPNASRFSTLGFDFSIQVYSYPERQLLLRINQNNLCIMSFSYNGGLLGLIIPRDGIVVYDIDNTDELVKYPGKFSCFTFSKGSSMLGCCYKEGFKVEIWCLKELIFTETRSEAKGIKILEFSNDDTLFVAGTLEGVLYLWDIRFGTLVSSLNLNLDILCLSFSGDNQIIGIGTSDRAVTLWAIHERNPISKLRGHRQNVNKLFFSKKNDILMSLDEKNYFMQWNINSRSIIKGLKKINEVSLSSAVLLDEELLTVGLDSSFMSWNLDNGYCKDEDQITFGEIDIEVKCGNETAFSYDGIYLAKVKNEDLILLSLWDTKTGTAIAESDVLPNDSGYIKNMVFSYDNRSLALCFQHELFIFNLKDFQDPIQGPLKTTENDQADTLSFTILKFSRNGLLASGTNNGLIIVWEGVQETSALKKKLLKEHEGYITALEFDPDKGNLLASGDGEGNIILWDVNKEETIGEMNRHEGPITCLLFFKNLTKMISAGEDFNMTMWNLNDYTVLHYFKGNLPGLIPLKLDLNLDESELIVGFNNGQLEIFRINHKVADTLYLIKYHHFPIMNLRYLENDHTILSQSSESSKVLRMKTEGSPIIYELDKPMALSFEGSKIISIVEDSTILVTKVNSEEIGLELIEHCTPIEFCTVSKRDGLLSGSQDGLMNYWDLNTGKLLVKNIKMTEKITASIAFDDKLILGGENGTIFLIDLLLNGQYNDNNQRNYVLNHSFKAHSKRITAIDNDYEGNIATAANDLKITIWHIVNNTVEKLIDIKEVIKAEIKELKFSLGGFYLYGTMKISNDIEELRKWEVHTGDSVLMKEKIKASRTFCINEDGRKVLTFMKVERNEWKLHLLNENLSKKSGIIVNLQEIGPREVPESISWSSNGDLFCFLKNRVVIYPDLFHDEEIFIKKLVRIGGFINDTNGMIVHMENNMLSMESIGRIYPFLYNLLHVMAYTDDYQGKFSDIVAALEKNRKILNINGFFERDIHDRIPFDILFMKKNRKLLQEFIEYFIKTYSTEEAYNAGFFKYLTIMKINELMMIFCEQTEFLSKVLDYIFAHPIDFPTRFYYRKLNKPFYILSKEPVLTIQKLKKTLIESKEVIKVLFSIFLLIKIINCVF